MKLATTEREQQRIDHLVLGLPRPAPEVGKKPKGMSKIEWRAEKARLLAAGRTLEDCVEQRVSLIEQFGGKQGTPETIAHLDTRNRRCGAIARLYQSRAINAEQLGAADEIATIYRAIVSDTPYKTASWETRTGGGGTSGDGAEMGMIQTFDGQFAIEMWLRSIEQPGAMLAIIARDIGLTIAAHRYGLSVPRTRELVRAALSKWFDRFSRGEIAAS